METREWNNKEIIISFDELKEKFGIMDKIIHIYANSNKNLVLTVDNSGEKTND